HSGHTKAGGTHDGRHTSLDCDQRVAQAGGRCREVDEQLRTEIEECAGQVVIGIHLGHAREVGGRVQGSDDLASHLATSPADSHAQHGGFAHGQTGSPWPPLLAAACAVSSSIAWRRERLTRPLSSISVTLTMISSPMLTTSSTLATRWSAS